MVPGLLGSFMMMSQGLNYAISKTGCNLILSYVRYTEGRNITVDCCVVLYFHYYISTRLFLTFFTNDFGAILLDLLTFSELYQWQIVLLNNR